MLGISGLFLTLSSLYRLGLDDLSLQNDCWADGRAHAEQPESLIWCPHLRRPFVEIVRTELFSGLHSGQGHLYSAETGRWALSIFFVLLHNRGRNIV